VVDGDGVCHWSFGLTLRTQTVLFSLICHVVNVILGIK
jgi:hypothetical protein